MIVKNINGTGGNTCKCGSWLEHWKKYSDQTLPKYCPEQKCINKPEVGAHVQKGGNGSADWFIVPLCKDHNGAKGATLTISNWVGLVPANVGETCGRHDGSIEILIES